MKFVIELNVSNAIWIFHSINFVPANFGRERNHFPFWSFHPNWGNHTILPNIIHYFRYVACVWWCWWWCIVWLFGYRSHQTRPFNPMFVITMVRYHLTMDSPLLIHISKNPIMCLIYSIAHLKYEKEKGGREMVNHLSKIRPKTNRKWFKFSLLWMEKIFMLNEAWRRITFVSLARKFQ